MQIEAKDMGTTGLIQWIWAADNYQSRGQRKRSALQIITKRYSAEAAERFKLALAEATVNRSCKAWALR